MIGRAYLYALGAAGELGVDWVLEWLTGEVRRTMALLGVTSIDEINADHIRRRPEALGRRSVRPPTGYSRSPQQRTTATAWSR